MASLRNPAPLVFLASLLLACGGRSSDPAPPAPPPAGEDTAESRAPDFSYRDVNPRSASHGQELALRDLHRERGLVLNFLASWCPPCWGELPAFQELARLGEAQVVLVAADEYGPPDDLLALLARAEVDLPVLLVPVEEIEAMGRKYRHEALPTTYLIDRAGTIRAEFEGALSEADLRAAVREHLPSPRSVAAAR